VLLPLTQEFLTQSKALKVAVIEGDLTESRAAWLSTMRVWQHLEMLQLGPASVTGARIGGADLRDHIYSFPITNACRVEQEWIGRKYIDDGWGDQASYQVKGLDALEHLLFKEGVECLCPDQARIVRDNSWANFVMDSTIFERTRWTYSQAIVADIEKRAEELSAAWQGDFGDAFERAESPFSAERDAVNQLFAAIFYMDQLVKDRKLGGPTGIHLSCLEEVCPEMIEHQSSGFGRAALIANLEGFIAVLRGTIQADSTDSFGLNALLQQEGASELGAQLEQLSRQVIDQLEASELSLNEELETSPGVLRNIHMTVREITELLKTQVVTTLNLSVPQEGAGDND